MIFELIYIHESALSMAIDRNMIDIVKRLLSFPGIHFDYLIILKNLKIFIKFLMFLYFNNITKQMILWR